ncbi:MAG: hypothetical protein ABI668_07590 [Sphingorhabdus sp.]
MRGTIFTLLAVGTALIAGIGPDVASAREAEPAENANCMCKTSCRAIIRPLTETIPIRKKDRDRARRILM